MPTTAPKLLSIPQTLAELRRAFGNSPSYSQLWARLVDGSIPGTRAGREWRIPSSELPRIAELFRLRRTAA